ncbi:MAG: hypothetical protein ACOCUF_03740 [Patescibacteria group bacterium]
MSSIINRGAIKNHFQLVVQSNYYPYILRNEIEDPLFFSLFKKLEKGNPPVFKVKRGGLVADKSIIKEDYSEQIQELRVFHINDKGQYVYKEGDIDVYPVRLYRKFVKTKAKDLQKFIDKYNFCAFPVSDKLDQEHIGKEHREIIEKNLKLKFGDFEKLPFMKNMNYLLMKHYTLKMIVDNFDKNTLNFASIDWLNKQVSINVEPALFDMEGFLNQEVEDCDVELSEEEKFENYFSQKYVNMSRVIRGYRIFGHFALCCYELLCDIEKYKLSKICQHPDCNKKIPVSNHGNKKYCSKKCYRDARKIKKREERKEKLFARKEIKKRKEFPKRF